MNTAMNTTPGKARPRWLLPAAAALAVILLIYGVFRQRPGREAHLDEHGHSPEVHAVATVAAGEAGKVGDLQVTGEAMDLAEIRVAPARRAVVADRLDVSGVIETGGNGVAKVTPRVAGKVVRLNAVAGDTVRAGQTLGLIESAELAQAQAAWQQASARVSAATTNLQRQRRLAQLGAFGRPSVEDARRSAVSATGESRTAESEVAASRADIAEAESKLQALRAALSQAETQVRVAKSRMDRADALLKEQLISRQEWEGTQAEHERAQADVDAARANVREGQARVASATADLDTAVAKRDAARARGRIESQALAREEAVYKGRYNTSREIVQAETDLREARLNRQAAEQAVRLLGGRPGGGSLVALTTPIGGRVQARTITLGETVDPEHAAFTVVNLGTVWAQLSVPARDLPHIREGQTVELTAETVPGRTFKGVVSSIGAAAEESTRAVPVRVAMDNPGGLLKPGAYVRGRAVTDVRRERVVVPEGAIQDHTNKKTVYVAKAGRAGAFEVRHVVLGARVGDGREVARGLEPGERIAVNGTFYLKSEALKDALSDGCCAVPGGEA